MFFKEFLYFTKSDRIAIIFLLVVATVAIIVFRWANDLPVVPEKTQKQYAEKQKRWYDRDKQSIEEPMYDDVSPTLHPFPFDPNTATAEQLLSLGLRKWQVRSLLKYRANGGVFSQPSDFAKLYGLTQGQYRQLEPYIHIAADYRPAAELFARKERTETYRRDTLMFPVKIKQGMHVLLNSADTSELKRVPGIGSYFARQIVNYRKRLGGFAQVSQLAEIDDFPTDVIPFFMLSADEISKIQKLNLNRLTLNELKRHPYINFYMARAITDYRRLHGELHSLDDLRLLKEFPQAKLQQLKPYVEF